MRILCGNETCSRDLTIAAVTTDDATVVLASHDWEKNPHEANFFIAWYCPRCKKEETWHQDQTQLPLS